MEPPEEEWREREGQTEDRIMELGVCPQQVGWENTTRIEKMDEVNFLNLGFSLQNLLAQNFSKDHTPGSIWALVKSVDPQTF